MRQGELTSGKAASAATASVHSAAASSPRPPHGLVLITFNLSIGSRWVKPITHTLYIVIPGNFNCNTYA